MDIRERTYKFVKFKGITMKKFEQMCGLSNGYVSSMRHGFGPEKLTNVLLQFPDLSREWLLYGEGEMLKTQKNSENTQNVVQNNQNGDNIQGQQVTIKREENDYITIIKMQAEQIAKSQEQIDRLISIIEKR